MYYISYLLHISHIRHTRHIRYTLYIIHYIHIRHIYIYKGKGIEGEYQDDQQGKAGSVQDYTTNQGREKEKWAILIL